MTRELSVLEVLEIAEQMEREAARFYRKAASMYRDPSMSKLFSQLAQWEKGHMQVFAEMKERLTEPSWKKPHQDSNHVAATWLGAPSAVFNEFSDPARELAGAEDRADVIRLALQKERDTIGYYVSLTEFALGSDNLRALRDIVQEERRHVKLLTQSLQQASY